MSGNDNGFWSLFERGWLKLSEKIAFCVCDSLLRSLSDGMRTFLPNLFCDFTNMLWSVKWKSMTFVRGTDSQNANFKNAYLGYLEMLVCAWDILFCFFDLHRGE